jgi:thiosulfate/3-mercaptopyruvate sulfurtransferase
MACGGGSSGGGFVATGTQTAEASDLVWSTSKLNDEMAKDQDLLILDCRKNIANPGPDDLVANYGSKATKTIRPGEIYTPYYVEHIKGSHYINFFIFGDPYYPADDTEVIKALRALGIKKNTKICLYDTAIANPQGKVFFHLERLGLTNVHILDGGLPLWKAVGGAVSDEPTKARKRTNFTPTYDNSIYLEIDGMKQIWNEERDARKAGKKSGYALIDYREDPLYYGPKICPDAVRTGHMTYTTLLNWKTYFDSSTGKFKSQSAIDQLTRAAGGSPKKTNILICNKGWRTGLAYFALRYAGWPRSSLVHYVGGIRAWTKENPKHYPMVTEACYDARTNMPPGSKTAKRFSGASAQVDDLLYCIGGYKVSSDPEKKVEVCDTVQAFDFNPGGGPDWLDGLTPIPEPLAFSVGATIDDYIYVLGGINDSIEIKSVVYRANTLNSPLVWETMAPMPDGRFSYAAAAVNTVNQQKIYVFGGLKSTDGNDPSSYASNLWAYDLQANAWEVLKPPKPRPHGRRCHALVAIDDTIYLLGGFYKNEQGGKIVGHDLDDIWSLDTLNVANGWQEMNATLPHKVAGHYAVYSEATKNIYVPGGWTMEGIKYDVYEYDPAKDKARQLYVNKRSACIGWPRYWYFIGAYGDEIATIGGYGGGPGYISTTDHSGFTHFHQPYVYCVVSPFDP